MTRRRVRVSDSLFEQLDELFGAERGPNGEPSRHDFRAVREDRMGSVRNLLADDHPTFRRASQQVAVLGHRVLGDDG